MYFGKLFQTFYIWIFRINLISDSFDLDFKLGKFFVDIVLELYLYLGKSVFIFGQTFLQIFQKFSNLIFEKSNLFLIRENRTFLF